ncbi:MAG: hypothetical protein R2728_13745 [Chitinophagales bacterium]
MSDGTFRGAQVFSNEFNIPFIGLPGTIDNDLSEPTLLLAMTLLSIQLWRL